MSIEQLCQLVEEGKKEEAEKMARSLVQQNVDLRKAIDQLIATMERVGESFSRLDIFLPAMMLAGQAMSAVMKILTPRLAEQITPGKESQKAGRVIIGTVKGDLHEIGKNIVRLMLEASGFEVKDLGYDVDTMVFIKEAEAMKADFIAASSLMTTTMPHQKEIIDLLKDKGLREKYKVVIGGAPTTQEWADKIGADLYCYDAGSAPRKMTQLLTGRS